MAKRKNGEGTWGKKNIKGVEYQYFRDSNGKYFYGRTQKEVKAKREKYESNKVDNKTTFGEYLLWYYDNIHKNSVEKSTYAEYKRVCKIIIDSPYYDIGCIQMGTFTDNPNHFQNYINAVTPYYALNTIRGQYLKMKMAVKYAETHGMIEKGLMSDIKMPKESVVGHKAKEVPFLTKEIADKLYVELKEKYYNGSPKYGFNAWICMLCIHTGLRIGEIKALRWNDIDLSDKTLRVDESIALIQQGDGTYTEEVKPPKNQTSNRIVPLNSIAIEMIENIRKKSKNTKPNDFACLTREGNFIKNQHITRTIDRMLRNIDCEITHCSPHALRHTFGSILHEQGASIKDISKLLGHKNISTTANIYVDVTHQKLVGTVKLLESKSQENEKNGEK